MKPVLPQDVDAGNCAFMQALSVRSEPIEEIGSDVDTWTASAGVVDGYGFRPVNRGGQAAGLCEEVVWRPKGNSEELSSLNLEAYCAPSIRAIAAQLVPAVETNWFFPYGKPASRYGCKLRARVLTNQEPSAA